MLSTLTPARWERIFVPAFHVSTAARVSGVMQDGIGSLMKIERDLQLVEDILGRFNHIIGVDFEAYRNHVYRVINCCYSLAEFDAIEKQKIQIAACFHDIGIWTEGTLDYLPPSESVATSYLAETGNRAWVAEVLEMIEMHHRIRSCSDSEFSLVEPFRRADIADFSLGLVPMGVSKTLISRLKSEFPNKGFHKRLVQLGSLWFFRHPFNPLPMFRR